MIYNNVTRYGRLHICMYTLMAAGIKGWTNSPVTSLTHSLATTTTTTTLRVISLWKLKNHHRLGQTYKMLYIYINTLVLKHLNANLSIVASWMYHDNTKISWNYKNYLVLDRKIQASSSALCWGQIGGHHNWIMTSEKATTPQA